MKDAIQGMVVSGKRKGWEGRPWFALLLAVVMASPVFAGIPQRKGYEVQAAVERGNLQVFPIVGGVAHDTGGLLTLDEGVRSGEVTVTEAGNEPGLVRRPGAVPRRRGGAEVNRLVLTNNSSKPLLLLAGEIVTGGKQDRVIGADRIVPAHSGPMDLGVFCVEPGRWVESSAKFGSMQAQMAQPSVRTPAMAAKDQQEVWNNVGVANRNMAGSLGAAAAPVMRNSGSSYAKVFATPQVQGKLAEYGDEQSILRELRERGAVGVVVAVNGRVIWADVFASTELLARYWPKLYKSYVAEAMTFRGPDMHASRYEAQDFLAGLEGRHETSETEPGIFRSTEIRGDGFKVFLLTSLLSKSEYELHITKMRS